MEAAAAARQARLAEIRARAAAKAAASSSASAPAAPGATASSEGVPAGSRPRPPPDADAPRLRPPPTSEPAAVSAASAAAPSATLQKRKGTVEDEVESYARETLTLLAKQRAEVETADPALQTTLLKPQKLTADLDRILSAKQAILDRRTQVAVAELVRERLQAQGSLDLSAADAVQAGSHAVHGGRIDDVDDA
ncbi:hypothetical protein CXG81DRAFT_23723 [Caulochytrium protostelioides]|uniref:Uncharacterized protein n=1 Tax=Caulochytrium protostelioides TaxID=1555241 RepID=A0A4P9XEN3_9FUNG|nr:hypothetical protein CXG81DRAFT_23723 [Caulochytrium protostelioides]|eukprot:RKP03611.1 hypothetical protein CXG81DRAFT_23723 [Caulochytrium protostelioides]